MIGDAGILSDINEIVFELILRSGRPFTWTSLQVHRNVKSPRHVDDGIGLALLAVTGTFAGGKLLVDGHAGLELSGKAVFFQPEEPHQVTGHTGDRLSLVAYRHPALDDARGLDVGTAELLRASGFRAGLPDLPSRTAPVRVIISAELVGQPDVLYIGRGHAGFGLPRSAWANPFTMSRDKDRRRVIKLFRYHFAKSKQMTDSLEDLGGKRLACHCPLHLVCHGDVLVEAYADRFLPPQQVAPTEEKLQEHRTDRLTAAAQAQTEKLGVHPRVPSIAAGLGPPITIKKGEAERLLVDGGGLCSPGQWAPWPRRPAGNFASKVRAQLDLALREDLTDSRKLIERFSAGGVDQDPFSSDTVAAANAGIEALLAGELRAWRPSGTPLPQNIDVRLLSVLLTRLGDPDADAFAEYECGVALGVGVEMPRTPLVFAQKVRWNVPGQADSDGSDVVKGDLEEQLRLRGGPCI